MKNLIHLLLILLFWGCVADNQFKIKLLEQPAILITNGGENSISVLDPIQFTERGRIYLDAPQNSFLHHIAINSDQNKLVMAFPEFDFSGGHSGVHNLDVKGNILIYDRQSERIEKIIQTPFANHNAFLTHDNREVWTTLVTHTGKILVYDAQSGELIKEIRINPDPHEILLTQDGKYAVTTSEESSFMTVVDVQTKTLYKEIKVDPLPTHVWFGKDANQIIVENGNMNAINFVDMTLLEVTDFIDLDFKPGMAGVAPNGELWVCGEYNDFVKVFKKDNEGWKETHQMNTGQGPHYILFHEGKALVLNQIQNNLEVYDLQTKNLITKVNVGLKPNAIVFLK